MISTDDDFREYLVNMASYYKAEYEREDSIARLSGEAERRMMILVGTILHKYDKTNGE